MVELSYEDLLDLLRYTASDRHPLEILGYEYSTRGVRQFRRDCPDFLPEAVRLIHSSLEETGTFPREPGTGVLEGGTYLEYRAEGVISLHRSVEVSMSQTASARFDFTSMREATFALLRQIGDPAYLRVPPP